MKNNANARLRIIEVATDLFHKKGVNATSVDDILEASGTGKGQFYHYFKSKDGLVHEVLKSFYHLLTTKQLPVRIASEIETWEDLDDWFKLFIDFQRSVGCTRSCPIGTIGNDLMNSQEFLRQDVRLIFEFTRHYLSRFFTAMKLKGDLPNDIDPDGLASLCFTVQQGGMLITKIERNEEAFRSAAETALKFIKALRIHK